ncbi:LysM peptidoglycan-binding domain-containing protein, partial [Kitasatospora kazusensis]|uniref:LysM peptidoglycan-binding domain-containing protein n=1 Tax=Kitasatospora kazusensis TaxID=407974 RepID=UPI0031D5BA9B
QGPGAWPVCSVKAGLSQGGAAAQVDTSSSNSSNSSSSSSSAPVAKAPKAAAAPKSEAHRNAAPKADTPAAKGHGNTPAHKSEAKAAAKPSTGGSYTVKSGDTLSAIAAAKGVDLHTLYSNNAQVIGGNADVIFPGQVLSV